MVFTCTTINGPQDGEPPRTQQALSVLQAVGSILDKPQWWYKWSTQPHVRARWFREIDEVLVRRRLQQFATHWPRGDRLADYTDACLLQVCLAAASISDVEARNERIRELTAMVPYPPTWHQSDRYFSEGYYEEVRVEISEDEDEDVKDETAKSSERVEFKSPDEPQGPTTYYSGQTGKFGTFPYTGKAPFGQILWYMKMRGFHESLRVLSPAEWTEGKIRAIVDVVRDRTDPNAVARAASFILETLHHQGPPSTRTVEELLGDPRKHVVKFISYFCKQIHKILDATKVEISETLDKIIQVLELPVDGQIASCLNDGTPGPAPRTWIGDGIIPVDIKASFIKHVAILEEENLIWHFKSNQEVLDLVHPSLYCIVKGITKYLSKAQMAQLDFDSPITHLQQIMTIDPSETAKERSYSAGEDDYQWIPSDVDIGDDGTSAKFVTYINNLHPATHASMYEAISVIFGRFVPLFNRVLSTLCHKQSRIIPLWKPTYNLKGRRCQVIVQLTEIQLAPENPRYDGGSWHIAGTSSEQIIATGLYYFGSENITQSRLSFRSIVREPKCERGDEVGTGLTYGLVNSELLVQSLGSLTVIEDRCVVFPNLYQHKVEPFELADPSRSGILKVLAFFLVNPSKPVLSTAVVPPQQQEWMDLAQEPVLKRMKLPEGVEDTVRDMIRRPGMTLEDAKQHRRELMTKRAASQPTAQLTDDL